MNDDLERLRLDQLAPRRLEAARPAGGSPAFIGQVKSTGSNLAVGKFFLVNPAVAIGTEAEAAAGTLAVNTSTTVPVYLVGPGVPATGDYLLCRSVDFRWVAERSGSSSPYSPYSPYGYDPVSSNCLCTEIPGTIAMHSANETGDSGTFRTGTISYQPTPAAFSTLGLGSHGYFGDQYWPDPTVGGDEFCYYLTCQTQQFTLTRLYPVFPFGSPYRDAILYTWEINYTTNTCTPFSLTTGVAYPGSDPTCVVTLSS